MITPLFYNESDGLIHLRRTRLAGGDDVDIRIENNGENVKKISTPYFLPLSFNDTSNDPNWTPPAA